MEFTTKEEADAAWANEEASGNKSPEVHAASMRFYDRQYSGQTADLGNGSTVLTGPNEPSLPRAVLRPAAKIVCDVTQIKAR